MATADSIQTIAGYIALAIPVTAAITNLAKISMEWLKQRHTIQSARIEQSHQITTHYLDRALDPSVPLAIRHQLLRFLATPDNSGSRLSDWAASELKRVGGIVDETNRAVAAAEKEIQTAQSSSEIANAERKLADATRRQMSLLDAPVTPPVTAAALRAGLVKIENLVGLVMKGENLVGARLYRKMLRGADFSEATLDDADFNDSDLRTAIFVGANLKSAHFYRADLRGAILKDANIELATFRQARLEGTDMRAAGLDKAVLAATFDTLTLWPDGFDPVAAGAVLVDPLS